MGDSNQAKVNHGTLPPIVERMLGTRGSSILIKGGPGTGKTILSLEMARGFSNVVFITTNESPAMIREACSPILHEEDQIKIIDGRSHQVSVIQEHVRQLENEKNDDPIIIVDAVGPFVDSSSSAGKELEHLIDDNAGKIKFILITSEKPNRAIEARFGCILLLEDLELEGRQIRQMRLVKSHGIPRKVETFFFTLLGGRFTTCMPIKPIFLETIDNWAMQIDRGDICSTGSESFDTFFGGGLHPGSFNIIELDTALPNAADLLILSPIINFLNLGRGVIVSTITPAKESKSAIMLFCEPEVFNDNIRFLDESIDMHVDSREYIYQLNNRENELFKVFPEVYDELGEKTNYSPVLSILEYNPLDYQDHEFVREMIKHIKLVKSSNLIELALIQSPENDYPDGMMINNFAFLSDTHIKIHSKKDIVFITGIKPYTNHYKLGYQTGKTFTLLLSEML